MADVKIDFACSLFLLNLKTPAAHRWVARRFERPEELFWNGLLCVLPSDILDVRDDMESQGLVVEQPPANTHN